MLPLDGVRVVDLTIAIAGPTATSLLADLGAEVIRIDNVSARRRASGQFHLNRGKKGIILDLNKPEARDVFLRLVRVSDVVVENFSPRVMPKFDLTYAVLAAASPRIIMISMPAFGSTGPYAQRTGYGPGTNGMSGLSDLTGFADGPPTKPGNIMGDFNAAFLAVFATMSALHARKRTRHGRHIELAMREGETQLIGEYIIDASMNHRVPKRTGNSHPSMAPHNVYPCLGDDAWVSITVGDDAEWHRLRAALGDPAWARQAKFDNVVGRWVHRSEIDRCLAEWTGEHTPYEVLRHLQQAGVTSGAVLNARDLAADAHYLERGFVQRVDMPEGGSQSMARPGYVFSAFAQTMRAGPVFAEHNDYVFFDLLHMTREEVAHLEAVHATSRQQVGAARS